MREPKPGRKAGRNRGTRTIACRVSDGEWDRVEAARLNLGAAGEPMTRGQFMRWAALSAADGILGTIGGPSATSSAPASGKRDGYEVVYDE